MAARTKKAAVESGTVRWRGSVYPARRAADGTITRNEKVDGSGTWLDESHAERFTPEGVDNKASRPTTKDGRVFVLRSVRSLEEVWNAAMARAQSEGVKGVGTILNAALAEYAADTWTPNLPKPEPKKAAEPKPEPAKRTTRKAAPAKPEPEAEEAAALDELSKRRTARTATKKAPAKKAAPARPRKAPAKPEDTK